VEFFRTQRGKDHPLVEATPPTIDAEALTDQRAATVAAHQVVGLEGACSRRFVGRLAVDLLFRIGGPAVEGALFGWADGDTDAITVLLHPLGHPAEERRDRGE
jgi:hypothetical protein